MQILSLKKVRRPETVNILANVAARFDVLAVQEVGSNASTASGDVCREVLDLYTAAVNRAAHTSVYRYISGNQFGILYRSDRVELLGSRLYSGSRRITYMPLTAYFKAKNAKFDFCIVTVHTRPDLAEYEIPALRDIMKEVGLYYGDPDVICAGDYNGDKPYYEEGPGEKLSGFSDWITGIPNSADTSIAVASKTYDRIEMTPSLDTDYTGKWGVLIFSELFDITSAEGTTKTAGTEAALSDHYPVWCRFYIKRDKD